MIDFRKKIYRQPATKISLLEITTWLREELSDAELAALIIEILASGGAVS